MLKSVFAPIRTTSYFGKCRAPIDFCSDPFEIGPAQSLGYWEFPYLRSLPRAMDAEMPAAQRPAKTRKATRKPLRKAAWV